MDCQYGHQYYKSRQTLNKRVRLQGTRKMGCKAHIVQRQYILYPEFSVATTYDSKRKERLAKEECLNQLRAHIGSNKPEVFTILFHSQLKKLTILYTLPEVQI